jgi:hypothetical protein
MDLQLRDNSNTEILMSVSRHRIKMLISVLMESPIYLTLSLEERYILLKGLIGRYPFIFDK